MSWRTLWGNEVVPLVPHCQWMAPAPTFLVTLFGPKLSELLGETVIVVVAPVRERRNGEQGRRSADQ